eukprot:scaffold7887_cov81-Skeletonema_dohrnii-CCMP3373.AAC.3
MIIGRDGDERSRNKCSAGGCTNIAQGAGMYKRHGANAIRRISEGYTDIADIEGVLPRKHGAKFKRCSTE